MKKLLRLTALLLVLVMALGGMTMFANADLIYEPSDSFYQKHREDCSYENRNWLANGYKGEVILYKSPENSKVRGTVKNGERLYVSYIYTNKKGEQWALAEYWGEEQPEGWCPMAYLAEVFDNDTFHAQFADGIKTAENLSLDESYKGQTVVLWYWPGSSLTGELEIWDEWTPSFTCTYTDEQGRLWGEIGYYYGYRDRWICIDAPQAEGKELYPEGLPDYDLLVEPYEGKEIVPGGKKSAKNTEEDDSLVTEPDEEEQTLLVCAAIVGAVVLVTAVLLVVLRRSFAKKRAAKLQEEA